MSAFGLIMKGCLALTILLIAIDPSSGQSGIIPGRPGNFALTGSRFSPFNSQITRGTGNNRLDEDSPVIINGILVTDRTQFPWMVKLLCIVGVSSQDCGGVIIANNRVLTAAHCVAKQDASGNFVKASPCTVYYGGLDSTTGNEGADDSSATVLTANIVYHPSYTVSSTQGDRNDIAVLKLTSLLTFNTNVNKINLPASGANYQDQGVGIAGWGVDESGSVQARLKSASTTVRTDSVCQANWNCAGKTAIYDSSSQICYSGLGVNGICSGDSGGPVFVGTGTTATLVGINSFVRDGSSTAGCSSTATTTSAPGVKPALRFFFRVLGLGRPRGILNQQRLTGTDFCRIDTPSIGTKVSQYVTWIGQQ